jgi:hypothetical protein
MAVLVYVMPKHKLHLATQRPADMMAALNLSLATTEMEVQSACKHPVSGCYDIMRHQYLAQTFTAVFCTSDKQLFDVHKDFQVYGGHTEHTLFVAGILDSGNSIAAIPKGPKHSQPSKPKRKARKMQHFVTHCCVVSGLT